MKIANSKLSPPGFEKAADDMCGIVEYTTLSEKKKEEVWQTL